MGDLLSEQIGNGSEHARIRDAGPAPVQALEPLEADAASELYQPVDGFIHQSGIVTSEAGGGEQQGLGIDDPIIAGKRISRHTDGRPLVPEQIDHPRVEVAKEILE